ncbi:urea amidolyase, partial [Nocardia salmonicida]
MSLTDTRVANAPSAAFATTSDTTSTAVVGTVASSPTQRHIAVVRPGMQTTIQDWPGRIGYWHIGVPPSGPMDDLSFRLGNRVLGNPEGAAGLECT